MDKRKKEIFVAMSGGVDSSVVAALLKEQGHNVTGIFMRNWSDSHCTAEEDHSDVARICKQIDIPYYAVNFEKEYADHVFADFLEQSRQGFTPNPDILCNREIKFKLLFQTAKKYGADLLATGHYAQISPFSSLLSHNLTPENSAISSLIPEQKPLCLAKGKDRSKDQSYFLYQINPSVLSQTLFPLGHLEKKQVREMALRMGLVTATKKDSTGICFIGKRNFREFLSGYLPIQPGNMIDVQGNVLGQHQGIAFYTIGQRKGLGIGGAGQAWFVVDKDPSNNQLLVAQGTGGAGFDECPALFSRSCTVLPPHWLVAQLQEHFTSQDNSSLRCMAKIRYRSQDTACTLIKEDGHYHVLFDSSQRAVTPGQSIVFYHNAFCLGGAFIQSRSRENLP